MKWFRPRLWWSRLPWLVQFIIAYAVANSIAGIVENLGWLSATALWGLIGGWDTALILAAVVAIFASGVVVGRKFGRSADILSRFLDFDESLLRLLPSLATTQKQDRALKPLLEEALEDAAAIFGGRVHRAMILLATDDRQWIIAAADYKMTAKTVDCSRYSIGHAGRQPNRKGVARTAFLKGTLEVVHMKETNGRWEADHADYRPLASTGATPSYATFVAAPIEWEAERLGVLCLDSKDQGIFDGDETQQLISKLGTRIASAIIMNRRISEAHRQIKAPSQPATRRRSRS